MDTILHVLTTLNQWFWFGLAIVLVILEVIVGASFFLLWLGISSAALGIILVIYAGIVWQQQFLWFGLIALTCLLYWHMHLKHAKGNSDQPNLNRRTEQYVGRIYTLKEPIVNGRGRMQIHDAFWSIEGPDLPAGTKIKVVKVEGMVLKVHKAD